MLFRKVILKFVFFDFEDDKRYGQVKLNYVYLIVDNEIKISKGVSLWQFIFENCFQGNVRQGLKFNFGFVG